jgi:hypothetical protein
MSQEARSLLPDQTVGIPNPWNQTPDIICRPAYFVAVSVGLHPQGHQVDPLPSLADHLQEAVDSAKASRRPH